MKKELEELIHILAKKGDKKELLREIVRGELSGMTEDLLKEVAFTEQEVFCEQNGEAKNGFYPRDIKGLFEMIEDIRIPRTGDGGLRPFFIHPWQKVSYDIEDLVIAIYQGGCSIKI